MTQYSADISRTQSLSRLIEQVVGFTGPPDQFLVEMLTVQCRVTAARSGAVIRLDGEGRPQVVAIHPQLGRDQPAPVWLAMAAESLTKPGAENAPLVRPMHSSDDLYGQGAQDHLIIIPLRAGARLRGGVAFHLPTGEPIHLDRAREQLEWSISLLSLYEHRLTLQQRSAAMERLRNAQEVLAAANEQAKFRAAAIAVCNEVATRWGCHRVSVGYAHHRYVKIVAMSHTEKFVRKMKLVQDIEASMEEAIDQDVEVVHPSSPETTCVSRSAAALSQQHGPSAIVSLPLRERGEPVGVMTCERAAEQPWVVEEVESLRLTCELATARLKELYDRDRWFGARWAASGRKALAAVVGPKHTWMKLAAVLVLAAIVFLAVAKGPDRVQAPFVIEATQPRLVPAPFTGYLDEVRVEPGDLVVAGRTVLATLKTEELELRLNGALAERRRYLREADIAMRNGETAQQKIALARADQAAAEARLLEYQLDRARIVSPIDGTIVQGDLHPRLGAPVEKGDVMFEIAPLESLRATLMVPEDRVSDILQAQLARESEAGDEAEALTGQLAAAAHPGLYVPIEVEQINPMAEVAEQRNVFKVKAKLVDGEELEDARAWLRPGMEGLAKVDVGRAHYAWMWTRDLIYWVRMKLWL